MDAVRVSRGAAQASARRAGAAAAGGVKGDGGLVVVIGGSRAYAAPPYLAALAARRTGVHGVRIAAPSAPAAQHAALEAHLIEVGGPELDAAAVREVAGVSARMLEHLETAGARGRVVWLVGPGLGGNPRAGQVLDALEEVRQADHSAAVVVDGSLGGGAQARRRIAALSADLVLLNRAEAAALLPEANTHGGRGEVVDLVALAALAGKTGAVVVAKGDPDRITDGVQAWEVSVGHPGLARHGTGDVLAGAAAGLIAQRLPVPEAAALACHLVGTAGTALAHAVGPGWLSRELVDAVGTALRDLVAAPGPGDR
ncbi:NAD(P)H-hydrate dehydratase [Streptomyces sp. MS1.AVA.3]|uniref:NAD(P)H-hydrate dehydratase n=1 Tax=Streptomyces decoyicus TaxID=249567 RepID=UPI0030BFBF98